MNSQKNESQNKQPQAIARAARASTESGIIHLVSYPPEAPQITDTDLANARRFAAQHGREVRYVAATGWLIWDGTRWSPNELAVHALAKATAESLFDEIRGAVDRSTAMNHAKKSQSRRAIESMLWLARSEPEICARIDQFDEDPYLFNTASGTIDLRTGDVRPHNRDDLLTAISPVEFDHAAKCPLFERFLAQILEHDSTLIEYVRSWLGSLLAGDVSDQVLHFLYGSGSNGKSVFCEVLAQLLGEYAVTLPADVLILKRHGGIPNDIARLRGKRAAIMNETTQGSRFDEAKLKDLTGGDTLTARFLHREYFDFRPQHRIVIRGNHRPAILGSDDGIWRRLRLIPFTVRITEDEKDPRLLEKLRAELPGILNFALIGCMRWQREGLQAPPRIRAAVESYRAESDTLGRFIDDECEARSLAQMKAAPLYGAYRAFAERIGERWMSIRDFRSEMQRRGFDPRHTNAGNVYSGLELKADLRNRPPDGNGEAK